MSDASAPTRAAEAPGWPGLPPTWSPSGKSGVGTALRRGSRVWFTLAHGIVTEVFYPHVDQACIRDFGLVVTDGRDFFSEERSDTNSAVTWVATGVPAFRLTNTCKQGRYRVEKRVLADPERDVVLQKVRLVALEEGSEPLRLYVLLAPHLGNRGSGNTAWIGDFKGIPMLFAERDGVALALACSVPWLARSAGFVGVSDGWQDLRQHGRLAWMYERAANGNVALTAEVDVDAAHGEAVLALGFGRRASEAGYRALASLCAGFDAAEATYVRQWQAWQQGLLDLGQQGEAYRVSTAVLRAHESKRFPGGVIASLSIPWGDARGDDDLGGYHLVWPRDLVESAGALLAAGAHADAVRVIDYLRVTQEADGHWPQNMWLDGVPYWAGTQMDETAFPVLLLDLARREGALTAGAAVQYWPMARRALGFLVRGGPVTQEDRWEEDPGYSPFTLAVEIAALAVGAELADEAGEPAVARYLRETADAWNARIERWTYAEGTPLAERLGIRGYYVRIAPPDVADGASPLQGYVPIKNQPPGRSQAPATEIVSADALALVRFGLRAPDDPRILDTLRAIDALLRVETPFGPCWRRYNDDGYGEHEDGAPFDGTGVGRLWPLLAGERAHYALAAGRRDEAERLLAVLDSFRGAGGMLPEQVWDGPQLPSRGLSPGRPSGSAMPLVWAHAEDVKLRRSLRDGRVFDLPLATEQRYVVGRTGAALSIWRFNLKAATMEAGRTLRLDLLAPARVHWSADGWRSVADMPTAPTGLGTHVADLPTGTLPAGSSVVFTFFWPEQRRWEGADFSVAVIPARPAS